MLTHVSVRNYKSLTNVDVSLNSLTIFVGQNATGKSNFIDSLRFLSNALSANLEQAITDRGGVEAIRSRTHPKSLLHFDLAFLFPGRKDREPFDLTGHYKLEIGGSRWKYRVNFESFRVGSLGYSIKEGQLIDSRSEARTPPLATNTLFLPLLAEDQPVSAIRHFLTKAKYYTIYPTSALREAGSLIHTNELMDDGHNLNSVLFRMKTQVPVRFSALNDALTRIIPEIAGIEVEPIGESYLIVRVKHKYGRRTHPLELSQESDGTLRLLAILTALYQEPTPPLIALEEPELNVHPGALLALYEVIKETSLRSQILITTHSPDLIAFADPNELRVVEKFDGDTKISPLDERQIGIINDRLFSTSDLLRIGGLRGRT